MSQHTHISPDSSPDVRKNGACFQIHKYLREFLPQKDTTAANSFRRSVCSPSNYFQICHKTHTYTLANQSNHKFSASSARAFPPNNNNKRSRLLLIVVTASNNDSFANPIAFAPNRSLSLSLTRSLALAFVVGRRRLPVPT